MRLTRELAEEYGSQLVRAGAIRLTRIRLPPYSDGMISEFQELSDKIDQLAEMAHGLRRENAQLRQANTALVGDTIDYQRRLLEAHARVEALLLKIPPLVAEVPDAPVAEPQGQPHAHPEAQAIADPHSHAEAVPAGGGMQ